MRPAWKALALAAAAALAIIGCGGDASTTGKASDLRTRLDLLLGENLLLSAKTTSAVLGDRVEESHAYMAMLDRNGADVAATMAAASPASVKARLERIWLAYDRLVIAYANGAAALDDSGQAGAAGWLTGQFAPQLSAVMAGPTGLSRPAIERLASQLVAQVKQLVDDQAAGRWTAVFSDVRSTSRQGQAMGDAIAQGIVKKRPDLFPGDVSARAVGFRESLELLLQEHMYLVTMTSSAALDGSGGEYEADVALLYQNGQDLGDVIGTAFGTSAQRTFEQIWNAYIHSIAIYESGVVAPSPSRRAKALRDLTQHYVPRFAGFVASLTGLPSSSIAGPARESVLRATAVVNAQGAARWGKAAAGDRAAAQHMQAIGDPLAAAVVARHPGKFA